MNVVRHRVNTVFYPEIPLAAPEYNFFLVIEGSSNEHKMVLLLSYNRRILSRSPEYVEARYKLDLTQDVLQLEHLNQSQITKINLIVPSAQAINHMY